MHTVCIHVITLISNEIAPRVNALLVRFKRARRACGAYSAQKVGVKRLEFEDAGRGEKAPPGDAHTRRR